MKHIGSKLQRYLDKHGLSREAFGKKLKPAVTKEGVGHWCNNKRKPSGDYPRQIINVTNDYFKFTDFI